MCILSYYNGHFESVLQIATGTAVESDYTRTECSAHSYRLFFPRNERFFVVGKPNRIRRGLIFKATGTGFRRILIRPKRSGARTQLENTKVKNAYVQDVQ